MDEVDTVIISKHPGGRPKKLPDELRSFVYHAGFNSHENSVLSARADSVGIPVVEFIRKLALNMQINTSPSINRQALTELNRIGNNLNQMVRLVHAGKMNVTSDHIDQFATVQTNLLNKIAEELHGIKNDGNG